MAYLRSAVAAVVLFVPLLLALSLCWFAVLVGVAIVVSSLRFGF